MPIKELAPQGPSRKKRIENVVSDLASSFLDYDRKECEYLRKGEIEKAVAAGEITVNEILALFDKALALRRIERKKVVRNG